MKIFKRVRQWFCGHRYGFWIYQKPMVSGDKPIDRRTCRCCGYVQTRANDKKAALILKIEKLSLSFKLFQIQLDAIAKQMQSRHPYGGIIAAMQGLAQLHAERRAKLKEISSPWFCRAIKINNSNGSINSENLIVLEGEAGSAVTEELYKLLNNGEVITETICKDKGRLV